MTVKKFKTEISIMKFIGILCVVIGHCTYGTGIVSQLMYLLNLPIFFIASGYLFKNNEKESTFEFFGKKVGKFWIKYFLYNIIFVLLHNIFLKYNFITNTYTYSLNDFLFGIYCSTIFSSFEPFSAAMWFIPVLIISLTMYKGITMIASKQKNNKLIKYLLVLLFACIGVFTCSRNISFGLNYQICFVVLPFYLFGESLKEYENKINIGKLKSLLLFLATFGIVLLILHVLPGKVDMSQNYLWHPLLFYILSCTLYFSIYYVVKNFNNETSKILNIIKYVGNNTLEIMCLHFMYIKAIDALAFYVFHMKNFDVSTFPFSSQKLILLYVIFGIAGPLITLKGIRNIKQKITIKYEKKENA